MPAPPPLPVRRAPRNHGFLFSGRGGWTLSPAYDINPTPTDVRPRILTTNISMDDTTCDMELVREVAGYFGLNQQSAKAAIKTVATATSTWRAVARNMGARPSDIDRMASAFEHSDLERARKW